MNLNENCRNLLFKINNPFRMELFSNCMIYYRRYFDAKLCRADGDFISLLALPISVAAEENIVGLEVDGVVLESEVPPQIIEGSTMLPIRAMAVRIG